MIVASATVAHKPHAELDSIYQGQEPKGKTVLVFQRSKNINKYYDKKVCLFVIEETPITVSRQAPAKEVWPSPYH